jgi:hypothetical protein
VKDAQRAKTSAETRRTLSLIWSARALHERTRHTTTWYRGLLEEYGAKTQDVPLHLAASQDPA